MWSKYPSNYLFELLMALFLRNGNRLEPNYKLWLNQVFISCLDSNQRPRDCGASTLPLRYVVNKVSKSGRASTERSTPVARTVSSVFIPSSRQPLLWGMRKDNAFYGVLAWPATLTSVKTSSSDIYLRVVFSVLSVSNELTRHFYRRCALGWEGGVDGGREGLLELTIEIM